MQRCCCGSACFKVFIFIFNLSNMNMFTHLIWNHCVQVVFLSYLGPEIQVTWYFSDTTNTFIFIVLVNFIVQELRNMTKRTVEKEEPRMVVENSPIEVNILSLTFINPWLISLPIIPSWKRMWLFYLNLNLFYPKMLCANFGPVVL